MTAAGGGAQLQLQTRCRRCGAELVDDAGIAAAIERVLAEIDRAKQRWPVGVTPELRALAVRLRCRTGTCTSRGA